MACNFDLPINDAPETFVEKVRNALAKAGGVFDGDTTSGVFELSTPIGAIKGSYTVNGSTAAITVTDKPFFLSCDKIQEVLQGYL